MARRGKRLSGLLAATTIAGLGYANWLVVSEPIDISPAVSSSAADGMGNAEGGSGSFASTVVTLADLRETLDRPLFTAARRPLPAHSRDDQTNEEVSVAASTPQTVTTPSNSNLRLLGVMHGNEDGRRVLIEAENVPGAAWLKVGAEIGGWHLTSIDADSVILEASGTRAVLKLHPSASTARITE